MGHSEIFFSKRKMPNEEVKTEPFSQQELDLWQSFYPQPIENHVKFGRNQMALPKSVDVNFIRNKLEIFPDDLWIVTPAKSGTTWMQEIVWLVHTNCDISKAQYNQFYRIPFLELGPIRQSGPDKEKYPRPNFKTTEKNEENVKSFMAHSMDYVQQLQRPRIIKTHLGLELLPKDLLKTCKVNILLSLFLNLFSLK